MVRVLLILLLALPVVGHDMGATYAIGLPPQLDTTHHYIKEIKQKCDTIYEAMGGHDCTECPKCGIPPITFWSNTKCVDDTTWAHKIQIWLTPTELEQLMKLIEVGVYWDRDTSYHSRPINIPPHKTIKL